MVVRRITPEEWHKLEDVFHEKLGSTAPYVPTSMVVVAEDNGAIQGLLAVQLVVHAEPLWVSPECKDKSIALKLIRAAKRLLPDINYYFVHCSNEKVASLLRGLGLQQMPWLTYRWVRKEGE